MRLATCRAFGHFAARLTGGTAPPGTLYTVARLEPLDASRFDSSATLTGAPHWFAGRLSADLICSALLPGLLRT